MLTQSHIDALAGVVGRQLTADEIAALEPFVAARNDGAIAALLSKGRTKHGPTQIGSGTVMAALGDRGGDFLDAVEALGGTDRNVYWGFDPVRRGVLDLSIPAARAQLAVLKSKLPAHADDLDKLLLVGVIADPLSIDVVSVALNKAEGRA